MTPEQTHTQPGAATYLSLLYEVWPLLLAAFCISLFRGWKRVQESYLHDNFWGTLCNTILSSAVMALIAVGTTWCLPLLGVDSIDPSTQMGITIMVSAGGMKLFDAWMEKNAGYVRMDPTNAKHLHRVKNALTDEQQQHHINICPFKDNCGDCEHCLKRRQQGELDHADDEQAAHLR